MTSSARWGPFFSKETSTGCHPENIKLFYGPQLSKPLITIFKWEFVDNLISALEDALQKEAWYAAFSLMLTLPDICGKIEHPDLGSKRRYVEWFDKYVAPKHVYTPSTRHTGIILVPIPFLSGNDCYALRCAFLHSGTADLSGERVREVLSRVFVSANSGLHMNRVNNILQIDVGLFGKEIIEGVREWLEGKPTIPYERLLEIIVQEDGEDVAFGLDWQGRPFLRKRLPDEG